MESYETLLAHIFSLRRSENTRSLSKLHKLLERLGNPQSSFQCIHVVGTNGKGSTASILSQLLQETGKKIGLFTSPHLFDYRERFLVDGLMFSEQEVVDMSKKILALYEEEQATCLFFDFTMLLSVSLFAQKGVEIAVFEAGMGGKHDATSVLPGEATILTNVALEHQQLLGSTEAAILEEKLGILKPGTHFFGGRLHQSLQELAEDLLSEAKTVQWFGKDFSILAEEINEETHWTFRDHQRQENIPISLSLRGSYQGENLALALAAARLLAPTLSVSQLQRGCRQVSWKGRFETIKFDEAEIIFDGAHNPHALEKLLQSCRKEAPIVVFSCASDKHLQEMVTLLGRYAHHVYFFQAPFPRFYALEEIEEEARKCEALHSRFTACKSFEIALQLARNEAEKGRSIWVCGSLYFRQFLAG